MSRLNRLIAIVELIVGGGHGWGGREFARTMDEMFKFLGEHLKD